MVQVPAEGSDGVGAQGNASLLVVLAVGHQPPGAQVELAEGQRGELGEAEAGVIEQPEHRAVAQAVLSGVLSRLTGARQLLEILRLKDLEEGFAALGQGEVIGDLHLGVAFIKQPFAEGVR